MTVLQEFDEIYKPKQNHLDPNQGILFETYGAELEHIKAQPANNIWTLVDGDDGGMYWIAGMHFVNRVHYCVTEIPWITGDEQFQD